MNMTFSRRQVTRAMSATLLAAVGKSNRVLAQASAAPPIFWVQIHAVGGWDQMLFCDPKLGPRVSADGGFHNAAQLGTANGIPYVDAYALGAPTIRPVGTFFKTFASRMLVINGLDTFTNNHDVGERYSMSGSLLEGFPIFAAQVAGALGKSKVMPLVDIAGYDEAGGLIAPVKLDYIGVPKIVGLQQVNVPSAGKYIDNNATVTAQQLMSLSTHQKVRALAAARAQRLQSTLKLPGWQQGLESWRTAFAASPQLSQLKIPTVTNDVVANIKALSSMGLDAFQSGLAMAMSIGFGGPDIDAHGVEDSRHLTELGRIFEVATHVLQAADAKQVPTVVVMTSDFGRTPLREGSGSGHFSVASVLLLQSQKALELKVLPAGRVIGGTTGEPLGPNNLATVLQPRKINPVTHAFSDTGQRMTPAHVIAALRDVAGIADSPELKRFPIALEGAALRLAS
jgi:hypothetical protein